MKFYKSLFMIAVLFAMVCIAMIPTNNYAFAASQSRGVILFSNKQSGNEITITTTLKKNEGISSFELSLDYDSSVMTLTSAVSGDAISDITPSANYSTNPYKLSWESDKNVKSTGTLYTFKFQMKENVPNGSYRITYSYDNDTGINYFEEGNPALQKAKFSIETAVVTVNNGNVSVSIDKVNEDTTNWTLIIILSVVGVVSIGGVSIILIRHKKQKGWEKIAK